MSKNTYILPVVVLVGMMFNSIFVIGQTTFETKKYSFTKTKRYNPSNIGDQWFVKLQNLDTIYEGNESYHRYVSRLKKEMEDHQYSFIHNKSNPSTRILSAIVDTPLVGYGFEGNLFSGSTPNDNTMAISNDGIVVAAINTNIIFYDIKTDSLLKTISLNNFSDTLTTVASHQYDPKAIYDYQEDRFILVYLAGGSTVGSTSDIIVAFSESSNPMDDWNFYTLPGNAVNDTSWTDYPAISLSNDELIITGNLLEYGGSWQTSFRQSVVWQIDKNTGYLGDSLDAKLYYDIKYDGKNIRNIHPVRGGNEFYGPEIYLLSNQNFIEESDTFYLVKIDDLQSAPSANLTVSLLLSDVKYGMPPYARQPSVKRLATNDARVLGAFYQNGEIQFVGNSVHIVFDTDTHRLSGFYHGVIKGVETQPDLQLNIYNDPTDPLMEYGYPNISYCGTNNSSQHSIMTYDFSSIINYPGFGASFFEKDDTYSPMTILKAGESDIYVAFGNQRWGDYSGSQPKYNEPGKIWACGTYGKPVSFTSKVYATWISEIYSAVEDIPIIPTEFSAKAYPNPPQDHQMFIEFNLPKSEKIRIEIIDINGRMVALLYDADAKAGQNMFSFSTLPLDNGLYVIRIMSSGENIYSQKITVLQ